MITLEELFEHLQYGELYNISLSGGIDETKGITQGDWPVLITHLNAALNKLHTRFNLREKEITVQQSEDRSFYTLHSDYALFGPDNGYDKYIIDTEENPYVDDIIRINSVYSEEGCEHPLNDEHDCTSLYLPSYNVIQVPQPADENAMFVMCRTRHEKFPITLTDMSTVIEVPYFMLEILSTYIASRVHGMRVNQEAMALSANLFSKYEMLCNEVEEKNLLHNDPNNTNIKLGVNGWV